MSVIFNQDAGMENNDAPITRADLLAIPGAFRRYRGEYVRLHGEEPSHLFETHGFEFLLSHPMFDLKHWYVDGIFAPTNSGDSVVLWNGEHIWRWAWKGAATSNRHHPTWAACRTAVAALITDLNEKTLAMRQKEPADRSVPLDAIDLSLQTDEGLAL